MGFFSFKALGWTSFLFKVLGWPSFLFKDTEHLKMREMIEFF